MSIVNAEDNSALAGSARFLIPSVAQALLALPASYLTNQLRATVGSKRRRESDSAYYKRVVREAKNLGLLNADSFSTMVLPGFMQGLKTGTEGYGMTEDMANLMRNYGQELAWTSLLKNNPLLYGVNQFAGQFANALVPSDLRGNTSVIAKASSFNAATKELTVKMIVQTSQGQILKSREYTFASDTANNAIVGETLDVTGMFSNPNAVAPGGS
jgi:hypothetical protein